jgi:hypothetical protein
MKYRKPLTLSVVIAGVTLGIAAVQAAAPVIVPPTVPSNLAVPAGSTVYLVGHAGGTQNYVCLPKGTTLRGRCLALKPRCSTTTETSRLRIFSARTLAKTARCARRGSIRVTAALRGLRAYVPLELVSGTPVNRAARTTTAGGAT